MDDGLRPRITKKAIIIALVLFIAVFGAILFFVSYEGPSQDIPDSNEPMLDFVVPGSKIAGIQVLVKDGGLSRSQYEKVYSVLNRQLPEMEPDSRFFDYSERSLTSKASDRADDISDLSSTDGSYGGEEEEIYVQDPAMVSDRVEMEIVDTVVFTMISESNAEYYVEVYTAGDLTTAEVKIERK